MKLVVESSSAFDLSFHSSLYKMQTDQLSFERFEELFDNEVDEMPEQPSFEHEWKRCQNFCLQAEQAAVFVFVADVIEFIDRTERTLKFFVSYEIKSEDVTAKMTMNAGDIKVDYKMICGSESEINGWRSEIYKNLLAITSTSTMVRLSIKFEKQPQENSFSNFLCKTLKFDQINNEEAPLSDPGMFFDFSKMNDTEMMEVDRHPSSGNEIFFFNPADSYFKGVLVRLKAIDPLEIKLKVYLRSSHQIVTFARAIYCKYSERCSIDVQTSKEIKQVRNLITEINSNEVS